MTNHLNTDITHTCNAIPAGAGSCPPHAPIRSSDCERSTPEPEASTTENNQKHMQKEL